MHGDMSEQAVKNTTEQYFPSLNTKDPQGVSVACHFPHFRVMGNNTVYQWQTAGVLFDCFRTMFLTTDGTIRN